MTCSTTGVANLPCLQKLVLTANHITEPQGLTGLPSLRHLLLQGNLLCSVQDINLTMLVSPSCLACLTISLLFSALVHTCDQSCWIGPSKLTGIEVELSACHQHVLMAQQNRIFRASKVALWQ